MTDLAGLRGPAVWPVPGHTLTMLVLRICSQICNVGRVRPEIALLWDDCRVSLCEAGPFGEVTRGRENDLIDRKPVLSRLDPERLRTGFGEVDLGSEHVGPIPVVLPSPALEAAALAV